LPASVRERISVAQCRRRDVARRRIRRALLSAPRDHERRRSAIHRERLLSMPLEVRLLFGLALATAIVYAATPVAVRLAARFDFYDAPVGYKGHAAPTPYLGGAAVMTGFVVTVLALTSDARQTLPVLGGVVVLWAVGT